MNNIVIVGGGTSASIFASYLNKYTGSKYKITMIYDHSNPSIGVGESTTPVINSLLSLLKINPDKVINHTDATIKLGIKFDNWLNDGKYYYNNFIQSEPHPEYEHWNATFAQSIWHDGEYSGVNTDDYFCDNCSLPFNAPSFAYHVDANKISEYLQKNYFEGIEIVNDVIDEVVVEDNNIKEVITSSGDSYQADLFVDASGISRKLIKNLSPNWIDKSDEIPNDRAISFNVDHKLVDDTDQLPNYTLAEATKNGWIWQIPLQNRFGCGYVYSSKFTNDDEALSETKKWVEKNHKTKLGNYKIIKFDSGYYENQWIGNCVSVGLSSGFVEPLESTSIQTTIIQTELISDICLSDITQYQVDTYNTKMRMVYKEIFDFIRFHYYTNRTDSDYWKFITDNTPEWIKNFAEKISKNFITSDDFIQTSRISSFGMYGYNCISKGLGLLDKNVAQKFLIDRGIYDESLKFYGEIILQKLFHRSTKISHTKFIRLNKEGKIKA